MKIDVIIEIPKQSNVKYEFDRKTKAIKVDRILYGSEVYPQNYGFFPNTLDYDGDELDVLVIANQAFNPGTIVPVRLLGGLDLIDSGEIDSKLLAIIAVDPRFDHIQAFQDVPKHWLAEIQSFFTTYKNLQNKKVEILGWKNLEWAKQTYQTCLQLMQEYGQLSKQEFLTTMQQLYPDKYQKA